MSLVLSKCNLIKKGPHLVAARYSIPPYGLEAIEPDELTAKKHEERPTQTMLLLPMILIFLAAPFSIASFHLTSPTRTFAVSFYRPLPSTSAKPFQ